MPNKNLYQNRFAVAPSFVNHNRSQFFIPHNHKSTFNFGKLVPFYCAEVLPGDTFDITTKILARMSTPLHPTMDSAYLDYYWFFVPARLVWSHFQEFMGENKLSAWVQDIDYIIPHASVAATVGGVLDHFGIPTYQTPKNLDINFLPFRAYQLIWNEWFRNQNTTDPVLVNTGDDVTIDELMSVNKLLPVAKYFDFYTAGLPSPQKGNAVDLPLGDFAPLKVYPFVTNINGNEPLMLDTIGSWSNNVAIGGVASNGEIPVKAYVVDDMLESNSATVVNGFTNLAADLSAATGATVNQLRQAFQMQRLLELQARSGSRYVELVASSFGIRSSDARFMRPEYLGGKRIDLQMQSVSQASSTDATSPLGHQGAFSKTVSGAHDFVTSFNEHGYLIGVMCARTQHTYQQGLEKMWTRRGRFDLYWPAFAHIGEQPTLVKQIYAQGNAEDDEVFNYQEAWAEYRYKPNTISGAFRSTVDSNLDDWHYADYYTQRPIFSDEWMNETAVNVDRTLAVQSDLHDQLIVDMQINNKAARVMPLYSIPGLIDHM